MRLFCWTMILGLAAAPASAVAAQSLSVGEVAGDDGEPSVPAARAVLRSGGIHVDGYIVEEAWADAIPVTRFVQREPMEGVPADHPTEVRVLYDADAIYIAARMFDPEPGRIGDQLVRRDGWGAYDYFELSLDPNNDRRTGYRFRVSAAGVQRDVYLYDDVREDDAWDAVWQSAVQRDSAGWSAELRIPLSQLRYDAADSTQSWGVNFARRRLVSNELSEFALESRMRHGKVSVFGRLDGLHLPAGSRRIEVRPYTLASARTGPAAVGDPFFDGSDIGSRAGLDLRYGLGASYTLDVTVNPDFGQVEVDPAVVNLSAFETFFQEKRPFFVEDAQIFDFSLSGRSNRLFYSRRIGRAPHGSAPSGAQFSQVPAQTNILGAAKLTGRTPGGLSVGALAAVTGRESGLAYDTLSGRSEFVAEPRSQYGAVRVQQDFRDGASQIGAIATLANRELPSDGSFDFLTSHAYSAGIDFEHNWGGSRSRDWALYGFIAGSSIHGSPQALLRVQRASNHYFQRPDATRLTLDSTMTSMQGFNWRLQFERRSAKHWTGGVWLAEVTPGFEVNDLGFSSSGERLDGGARISYQEIRPGRVFRDYRVNFFTFHNFRHEALDDPFSLESWKGAHKRGSFNLSGNLEFLNYWGIDFRSSYSPEMLSDVATRGGPVMVEPGSWSLTVGANTDRRKTLAVQPSFTYRKRLLGGYQFSGDIELAFRPAPSWEIELRPQYGAELEPAQYVTSVADVAYASTFGQRYLFADLERRSVSLESRVNVAFSPTLTLQLFAQPLISSGNYLTYKQLVAPRTFDFDILSEGEAMNGGDGISCANGRICMDGGRRFVDFDADGDTDLSFSDRDFNIRSLKMNLVLRWEYRPGSTVYLVWQQSRSNRENVGTFDFGRDLDRLWNIEPENLFILKLTYWLGL